MKFKKNIKKNNIFFLLFFLVILLFHKVDFFSNFAKVILYKYDTRINKAYGYCSNTGVGYLKYLKNNFNFKSNPKIIVQSHIPSLNWAIYDFNKIYNNSDELIVLKYPGKVFSKTLERVSEYQFALRERTYSSNKVIGLEILGNFEGVSNKKMTFKLYSRVKTLEGNKLVKNSTDKLTLNLDKIENLDKTDRLYFPININLLNNYYIKGIYLDFMSSKKIMKNITSVKLFFENSIDINKYKIIHNYNNCYYLKK